MAATFFRRTYRDPVVEYYFLPERRDIRLTVRFGEVLIHREQITDGNRCWRQEACKFSSLPEAEGRAFELLSAFEAKIGDAYGSSFNSKRNNRLVFEVANDYCCCITHGFEKVSTFIIFTDRIPSVDESRYELF